MDTFSLFTTNALPSACNYSSGFTIDNMAVLLQGKGNTDRGDVIHGLLFLSKKRGKPTCQGLVHKVVEAWSKLNLE
jgi:hypothetical protein